VTQANIRDRGSIERVYPPEAFAVDAAENQKQPANELVRGVRIASPPDASGRFDLDPAARHVGEGSGAVFLAPYRAASAGAGAAPDPHQGYDAFIDDVIAAARELAATDQGSPGPGDARLRGPRQ
jgi:hypothetical protein